MSVAEICQSLEEWFGEAMRPLPWRVEPREPYWSLVSEFMLQQTQVSRVLEKFGPFVERFPNVESLAAASEESVLGAWSGLGYYRRARMLHGCAQAIVERHGGVIPRDVEELMALPGIGRYTAGAMASMVFGEREPLVDGNVMRVLQRLENNSDQQTDSKTIKWAWARAGALVEASGSPGVLNEALMELGATVCSPKRIGCDRCPVAGFCESLKAGTTESVPPPKPRAKRKGLFCASVLCVDDAGRVLFEQRPVDGMWGSMWQVPTVELDEPPTTEQVGEGMALIESFVHQTTHRIVRFDVYRGIGLVAGGGQSYLSVGEILKLGVSNAQKRILGLDESVRRALAVEV